MSENHIRPWRNIYRRKSRQINVGNVPIGGDAPIAVQTMTNTLTTDIKSTIEQVVAASEAGADLVRVSVPDLESSKALKDIVKESPVPIVADKEVINAGLYAHALQTYSTTGADESAIRQSCETLRLEVAAASN